MKSRAIPDLLRAGDPTAPAIGAPDRKTMTRAEVLRLVAKTGGSLRNLGIQQNHAAAISATSMPRR
jgi:oxalate---CoA ligase